jgi:hypothetical protein
MTLFLLSHAMFRALAHRKRRKPASTCPRLAVPAAERIARFHACHCHKWAQVIKSAGIKPQ